MASPLFQSPAASASSTGSSSSHRYEQMLTTVTSLQGDLQRTLGVCQALKGENEKIKSNYETVKTELVRLREKHSATRSQLLEAVEAKLAADRDTETLVHKWKLQLETRTRELAELQATLAPQDLDTLRARVKEELEEPHKRKLLSLETEVEDHRQQFFTIRRQYERCKAEYEQFTIDQGKEAEALQQSHRAETHALKTRVKALEAQLSDSSREDDLRLLQRRLEEMTSTDAQLHREMASLREEKEKAEVDKHKLLLSSQSDAAKLQSALNSLEAEKGALQRQGDELRLENSRYKRDAEDAKDRVSGLSREVTALKEQCDAREKLMLEARSENLLQTERLTKAWHTERDDFKDSVEQLTARAVAAEQRCREVAGQSQERCRQAQEGEARAQREAQGQVQRLQLEIDRLEEELDRISAVARSSELNTANATTRWQGEAEGARGDASRLQREKEALHQRMSQLVTERDRLKDDTASLRRATDALTAEVASAREALRMEQDRAGLQESELAEQQQHLGAAEEEVVALRAHLSSAREDHLQALKDLKNSAVREREEYAKTAGIALDRLRSQARKAVKKERKKSSLYKKQALDAHERSINARKTLHAMQQQAAVVAAAGGGGGVGGVGVGAGCGGNSNVAMNIMELSEALEVARARDQEARGARRRAASDDGGDGPRGGGIGAAATYSYGADPAGGRGEEGGGRGEEEGSTAG